MSAVEWERVSPAQRAGVIGAIVVAAAVRVTQLALKWNHPLMLNDSLWYSAEAVVLANGRGFIDPFAGGPSAEHGPLTPIVLAAVSWVGDPLPWQRALMTVVGMATVVGIMLIARRLGGWAAAIAAGWIAALYPNLWINDALVMSESLAILLVVIVVWFALDVVEGIGGWPRAAACGVAIGLAGLTRSELVLLAPIVVVVIACARWRQHPGRLIAAVAAGSVLVLAPWIGANLVRFERPVLLTTNDGTTLLGANCDDSYSGGGTGGWSLFCVLDAGGPPGEDPSVRSDRERDLARTYVADHLGRVPVVAAARVGRMFDVVGLGNMVHGDVGEERPEWASWVGIASFWVLAVLAGAGFWQLASPARWVLLAPVISVLITAIAFYGAHRIRAPAEPAIVVAAGLAAGRLAGRWARRAGVPA